MAILCGSPAARGANIAALAVADSNVSVAGNSSDGWAGVTSLFVRNDAPDMTFMRVPWAEAVAAIVKTIATPRSVLTTAVHLRTNTSKENVLTSNCNARRIG